MKSCSICAGSHTDSILSKADDRYGYPGEFQVVKCVNCGHKYLTNSFTVKMLDRIYAKYYPREKFDVNNVSKKRFNGNHFTSWIRGEDSYCHYYVKKFAKVIDVGCGFGSSLFYYRDLACSKIKGIDPDPNLQKVGEKYGFDTTVGMFSKRLAVLYKNTFDTAVLDQVIEHSKNPKALLSDIHICLEKKGRLIIATPNFDSLLIKLLGKNSFMWHIPYHLQFFNPLTLAKLVESCGFKVEYSRTRTSTEWIYYELTHYLLTKIVGTESRSAMFYPGKKRSLLELAIISSTTLFHMLHIDHLVSRLLDMAGVGENIIIVARKI
jgi:2-polyprenyl-3-methyl-5-hydroxy-6-metoxy-1,4-benzoquinol methylase